MRVLKTELRCGSPGGVHHLGRGIDPDDFAFCADAGSNGQGWLSGAGGDIEHSVASADLRVVDLSVEDQRLRDWRKHLPDDLAVLLPEGRGIAPSLDNLLVGLHLQKYTQQKYT